MSFDLQLHSQNSQCTQLDDWNRDSDQERAMETGRTPETLGQWMAAP